MQTGWESWIVQPGEGSGVTLEPLPVPKGSLQDRRREIFYEGIQRKDKDKRPSAEEGQV